MIGRVMYSSYVGDLEGEIQNNFDGNNDNDMAKMDYSKLDYAKLGHAAEEFFAVEESMVVDESDSNYYAAEVKMNPQEIESEAINPQNNGSKAINPQNLSNDSDTIDPQPNNSEESDVMTSICQHFFFNNPCSRLYWPVFFTNQGWLSFWADYLATAMISAAHLLDIFSAAFGSYLFCFLAVFEYYTLPQKLCGLAGFVHASVAWL
jgi:hypothetical protein